MIITPRIASMIVLAALVLAAGLGSLTKWGMDRGCIGDLEAALHARPDEKICGELYVHQILIHRGGNDVTF